MYRNVRRAEIQGDRELMVQLANTGDSMRENKLEQAKEKLVLLEGFIFDKKKCSLEYWIEGGICAIASIDRIIVLC